MDLEFRGVSRKEQPQGNVHRSPCPKKGGFRDEGLKLSCPGSVANFLFRLSEPGYRFLFKWVEGSGSGGRGRERERSMSSDPRVYRRIGGDPHQLGRFRASRDGARDAQEPNNAHEMGLTR